MLLPSKMPILNSVEDSFRKIEKSKYFSVSVFSQAVVHLSLVATLQHCQLLCLLPQFSIHLS